MSEWSVEIRGDDEAARRAARLAVLMSDLRPFWPRLVSLFVAWMGDQYATEGGWGGAPWAPLSPAYAAWKAARYPGRGILVRTGEMRRASTSPQRDSGPRMLRLTISDPKIVWHQQGTDRMPARPVIPDRLPGSALADIDRAAAEYVDDMVARLGL